MRLQQTFIKLGVQNQKGLGTSEVYVVRNQRFQRRPLAIVKRGLRSKRWFNSHTSRKFQQFPDPFGLLHIVQYC